MNKIVIILLTIFLITSYQNVYASSLWGKLKKRVGDEVENVVTGKVARKAGDKAGEATDAVLNPEAEQDYDSSQPPSELKREQDTRAESNPLSNLGGLGGMLSAMQHEVPIDEYYSFDFSVSAQNNYDGKKSTVKQRYSSSAFMVDDNNGNQVIMDLNNQVIIMLDKNAQTKTPMSTGLIQKMSKMGGSRFQSDKANPVDITNIKKTGKKKKVAGYPVEQWVFEDENKRVEAWFTNKVDFDFVDFTKQLSRAFGGEQSRAMFDFSALRGDYPRGLVMESKTYDASELKSHYLITKLDHKPTIMDLSMYEAKSLLQGMDN